MINYILSVFFYESQPRAGLWVGDSVLTTHVHKARVYPTWESVVEELKKLKFKHPHSHWQPLEVVNKDQNVIPFPTPDQEVQQQIDNSQDPGIRFAVWYHQCPNVRMDNIRMARGFVCLCGARAPDHDLGPSTGTAGGTA